MVNLSLTDLMDYTDWERQKRHLKVSAGPNGDRFETVGDLVNTFSLPRNATSNGFLHDR